MLVCACVCTQRKLPHVTPRAHGGALGVRACVYSVYAHDVAKENDDVTQENDDVTEEGIGRACVRIQRVCTCTVGMCVCMRMCM